MTPNRAISLRDLLFVRDVLMLRAWVQGPEVDELVALRSRIDDLVSELVETAQPKKEEPREGRQPLVEDGPGRD